MIARFVATAFEFNDFNGIWMPIIGDTIFVAIESVIPLMHDKQTAATSYSFL